MVLKLDLIKNKAVLGLVIMALTGLYSHQAHATFKIKPDLYGSSSPVLAYKGYQNDLSATLGFQYDDIPLIPFIRYVESHYDYKIETNKDYTVDQRKATGAGLDVQLFDALRFRFISESIVNDLSGASYQQESYGLIYNQYLSWQGLDFNNYAESFYIPRVSTTTLDTYLRLQILKPYYLVRSLEYSHAVYPLLQLRAKANDDANFGVSGQNISTGLGYKFYFLSADSGALSAVFELHNVVYQSRDLNSDWNQVFAALQWTGDFSLDGGR